MADKLPVLKHIIADKFDQAEATLSDIDHTGSRLYNIHINLNI